MMEWSFRFYLSGVPDDIVEWTNKLVDAGCNDASMYVRQGVAFVDFDREADLLQSAISSAKCAVLTCGYIVDHVEISQEALASWPA